MGGCAGAGTDAADRLWLGAGNHPALLSARLPQNFPVGWNAEHGVYGSFGGLHCGGDCIPDHRLHHNDRSCDRGLFDLPSIVYPSVFLGRDGERTAGDCDHLYGIPFYGLPDCFTDRFRNVGSAHGNLFGVLHHREPCAGVGRCCGFPRHQINRELGAGASADPVCWAAFTPDNGCIRERYGGFQDGQVPDRKFRSSEWRRTFGCVRNDTGVYASAADDGRGLWNPDRPADFPAGFSTDNGLVSGGQPDIRGQ